MLLLQPFFMALFAAWRKAAWLRVGAEAAMRRKCKRMQTTFYEPNALGAQIIFTSCVKVFRACAFLWANDGSERWGRSLLTSHARPLPAPWRRRLKRRVLHEKLRLKRRSEVRRLRPIRYAPIVRPHRSLQFPALEFEFPALEFEFPALEFLRHAFVAFAAAFARHFQA